MFKFLKMDFVKILSESDLFNAVVNYFVLVAGESSFPFDEAVRDLVQKEQQLVHLRSSLSIKNNYPQKRAKHTKVFRSED